MMWGAETLSPQEYEEYLEIEKKEREEYLLRCETMSKNIKKAWAKKQL